MNMCKRNLATRWPYFFILAFLSGCDIINPDENLPVSLKLSPFDFQVQAGQGSSRNKFTETWVFANSSFLGVFDPGATVYYQGNGPVTFTFRPGIRNNGILDDAIRYPMVTGHSIDRTVMAGDVLEIQPISRYLPEADFPLLADFELTNPFTDDRDTVAASFLESYDGDAFEGSRCGRIVISPTAHTINVGHAIPIASFPTDGSPAYLEFWYRNDIEFGVGLVGIDLSGSEFESLIYIAKPSTGWNMLYLDLSQWLEASGFSAYQIVFIAEYPLDGVGGEYEILLDNIKAVHL